MVALADGTSVLLGISSVVIIAGVLLALLHLLFNGRR